MSLMKVRYVGLSDYRILTVDDLKVHGITIGEHQGVPKVVADRITGDLRGVTVVNPNADLVWGPHNNRVLLLDVNDSLEVVLREQGHFQLSKVKDDGSEETVAFATSGQDAPAVVVANVDDQPSQVSEVT